MNSWWTKRKRSKISEVLTKLIKVAFSEDEYFDLSDEETNLDNSGNRGRETNSVKMEVLSYLNERRKELYVLKVYPRIMKVFRKYNCIIPSSAPAERLFSVAGGIFTPKRNMLGDGMFE